MMLGGTLMLIVMNANEIVSENQSVYNGDMLVQEMLTSAAQIIEGELRNMGFGIAENQSAIAQADTSSLTFLIDLRNGGSPIDTVRYILGPVTDLSHTQNTLDRYLYRRENSDETRPIGVVTVFHLDYTTRSGERLTSPVDPGRLIEIHVVEVTMEVQNPYAMLRRTNEVTPGERDAMYSSSIWQQTRLASQNSRR